MFIKIFLVLSFLLRICCSPGYCQVRDSIHQITGETKQLLRQVSVPVILIGLGIWGTTDNSIINHDQVRQERFEHFPGFKNNADNYLQFVPVSLTYTLDILRMGSKNTWQRQTVLLASSELLMFSMVYPLKKFTHILRPDSSSYNAFPSGHTAQAFLAATFFTKEYGKKYPWVGAGMYTLATGIGVLRILNNKHWISDVLAGAGIGILSVQLSYFFDKISGKRSVNFPMSVIPFYQQNHYGFNMAVNF